MDRKEFIHSSARIRVLEKKMLKKDIFERMIESDSLEDAIRILSETVYSSSISKLENIQDFDDILINEWNNSKRLLKEMTPISEITDILSLSDYYHDIKVFIKEAIISKDLSDLYFDKNREDILKWKDILLRNDEKNFNMIPIFVMETIKKYEKTNDPQMIDFLVDKEYFVELKKMSLYLKENMFLEFVENKIDFTNIDIIIRASIQETPYQELDSILIPGGKIDIDSIKNRYNMPIKELISSLKTTTLGKYANRLLKEYEEKESISDIEKYFDNELLSSVKDSSNITYGPEVLFAYLALKEREIQNLRIILISKRSGVESSKIRERMREVYV